MKKEDGEFLDSTVPYSGTNNFCRDIQHNKKPAYTNTYIPGSKHVDALNFDRANFDALVAVRLFAALMPSLKHFGLHGSTGMVQRNGGRRKRHWNLPSPKRKGQRR